MNTTSTVTWSRADEQRLQEPTERKAAFSDHYRGPIRQLILAVFPNTFNNRPVLLEAAVKAWIANADAIRDVLAPFDSGVRA